MANVNRIKKIIVATDFSKCSDKAFGFSVSLAKSLDAEIIAVFVNNADDLALVIRHEIPVNLLDKKLLAQKSEEYIENLFQTLRQKHGGSYDAIRFTTLKGHAWSQIVRFAQKEKADLIVTGTRSRSGLKKLVLGSTAARLIQHSFCPVLVVGEKHPK